VLIFKNADIILLDSDDLIEGDSSDSVFGALILGNVDDELFKVDRDIPLQELLHVCLVCQFRSGLLDQVPFSEE